MGLCQRAQPERKGGARGRLSLGLNQPYQEVKSPTKLLSSSVNTQIWTRTDNGNDRETPLGRHSHHSRKTHLIINGQIIFFPLYPTATTYSTETESNAPVTEGGRMKPPRPGLGERTSGVMDSRSGLFTVRAGEIYQAALSK
jgi:hypothetical protein